MQKKVKMNLVVYQVHDQEATASVMRKYGSCTNYNDVFCDIPPAEEETTIEQLTALWALVKSGAPPYVGWGLRGYHVQM